MKREILEPGQVVDGRYQILGKLGAGGFATVFDAVHLSLGRSVAVKVLDVSGISDDAYMERFSREARICAQLDHPSIVRIHDFGQLAEGQPYIAMEKLTGHDLEVELKATGPLSIERMLRLFVPVLEGLGLAHKAGIVHKDLKPSNLFLVNPNTPEERLVVVDFGIARVLDSKTQLTQAGSFAGTPAYLAPEYIQNQVVSPALDVYQMGLIIVETLSGRPVVRSESAIGYIMKHIQGEHDIPDGIKTGVLGAVLLKALSVDPTNRYPDGSEFSRALAGARLTVEPVPTLAMSPVHSTPPPSSPLIQTNSAAKVPAHRSSGMPLWMSMLILVSFFFFSGCVICSLLSL